MYPWKRPTQAESEGWGHRSQRCYKAISEVLQTWQWDCSSVISLTHKGHMLATKRNWYFHTEFLQCSEGRNNRIWQLTEWEGLRRERKVKEKFKDKCLFGRVDGDIVSVLKGESMMRGGKTFKLGYLDLETMMKDPDWNVKHAAEEVGREGGRIFGIREVKLSTIR